MTKKKQRPRAERRELERRAEKIGRDLDRLARAAPGGTPDRPIDLDSASQVEPHARSLACHRCGGAVQVEDHAAVAYGSERLRAATVRCSACGTRRQVYFRLGGVLH